MSSAFSSKSEAMVCARDISFFYGAHSVFQRMNFDIQQNSKVGLVGRNGSGKTHLLSCLAGILPVSAGRLAVNCKNIGLLASGEAFTFNYSVAELLKLVPNLDRALAKSLFLRFGHHLDKWLARTVFELSSGERQLLRLLCVLGQPQELYLLDEPEVHLDGFGRTCLAAYLSEIDAAVVLVSHDVSFRSSVVHDEIRIDSIE